MLCDTCADLFRRNWEPEYDGSSESIPQGHQPSTHSLAISVAQGCLICNVLNATPSIQAKLRGVSEDQSPLIYCTRWGGQLTENPASKYFTLCFTVGYPKRNEFNYPEPADAMIEVAPVEFFPPSHVGSGSTSDKDVLSRVQAWIHECIDHHETCRPGADSTWKPTRLVDLGESTTQLTARLIICNQHFNGSEAIGPDVNHQSAPYMTLSHCWAKIPMFKLENGNPDRNEASLCDSIPVSELSKTFKDAMQITKWLGVRYFWIDSLCIVQDSANDWRHEAATMSQVYKNSFCNLAATSAPDGSFGCFAARNPINVCAEIVRPEWSDIIGKEFVIAQPHEALMSKLIESPLLKRAWVLQERLLSPRMVHFTDDQVYFECHKYLACETYPEGIPDPHGDICKKCVKDYFIHRSIDAEEQTFRGVPTGIIEWNRLLERYTTYGITYGTDKIIALSGIATDFSQRKMPHDRYLAGFWESQVPDALLWRSIGEVNLPPEEYRAPSWSWASVDNAVSVRETERDAGYFYCELAEKWHAAVETIDNNKTGQVTGGELLLFGIVSEARFAQADMDSGKTMEMVSILQPNGMFHLYPRQEDWINAYFDLPVKEATMTAPILFVRYSARVEGSRYDGAVFPSLEGLILEQVGKSAFKRIGVFMVHGSRVPKVLEFVDYPLAKYITLI
ncbi:hypothetical protein ASPWEDRAFT_179513 [Aspergillus wentii DTO 134E9]|uniref:Heterokaryon incompatibility domain-containing protein n=1 Tax=Aspergillus wentii DTO 134E9 TaxID=1073089 RepID=A0A1L9S3U1_ASPWE|nr:uncharacterized protein ASPWEDRAFT_179513 [Aspergillus wentii DTO 134E9]OJJ41824.1 hypothetical protein ASPWEDRAFT_179513 [Aspergillus wentii DTO 134E9]